VSSLLGIQMEHLGLCTPFSFSFSFFKRHPRGQSFTKWIMSLLQLPNDSPFCQLLFDTFYWANRLPGNPFALLILSKSRATFPKGRISHPFTLNSNRNQIFVFFFFFFCWCRCVLWLGLPNSCWLSHTNISFVHCWQILAPSHPKCTHTQAHPFAGPFN